MLVNGEWSFLGDSADLFNQLGLVASDSYSVATALGRFAIVAIAEDPAPGVVAAEFDGNSWGLLASPEAVLQTASSRSKSPAAAYRSGELLAAWVEDGSDPGVQPGIHTAAFGFGEWRRFGVGPVIGSNAASRSPQLLSSPSGTKLIWVQPQVVQQDPYSREYESFEAAFAAEFSAGDWSEQVFGDASTDGVFRTNGAASFSAAMNASGRIAAVWDASGRGFVRGQDQSFARRFLASSNDSLQSVITTNGLGAGDLLVIDGDFFGDVTLTDQHSGLTIAGAPGARIRGQLVLDGVNDVVVEDIRVLGGLAVRDAANTHLRRVFAAVSLENANSFSAESLSGGLSIVTSSSDISVYSSTLGEFNVAAPATGLQVRRNQIDSLQIDAASDGEFRDNIFDGDGAVL